MSLRRLEAQPISYEDALQSALREQPSVQHLRRVYEEVMEAARAAGAGQLAA